MLTIIGLYALAIIGAFTVCVGLYVAGVEALGTWRMGACAHRWESDEYYWRCQHCPIVGPSHRR